MQSQQIEIALRGGEPSVLQNWRIGKKLEL